MMLGALGLRWKKLYLENQVEGDGERGAKAKGAHLRSWCECADAKSEHICDRSDRNGRDHVHEHYGHALGDRLSVAFIARGSLVSLPWMHHDECIVNSWKIKLEVVSINQLDVGMPLVFSSQNVAG
jgi:hypothetical protein